PGARPTDPPIASETYLNLSNRRIDALYAPAVVGAQSSLITLVDAAGGVQPFSAAPAAQPAPPPNPPQPNPTPPYFAMLAGGIDGVLPGSDAWNANAGPAFVNAVTQAQSPLDRIAPEIFNILCIPAAANFGVPQAGGASAMPGIYQAAL